VDYCPTVADSWKPLRVSAIKDAIDNPIECRRLEYLARGRREVVILFDDMTRPTRPYLILPHILRKLHACGIKKQNIRFIIASGSHGACGTEGFRKKLGSNIVKEYAVYNHNCFENCKYMGRTSAGIPLYVNREFALCDLRIGIGTVLPHVYCGYSGGGKMVLPGISHIKTIERFHTLKKRKVRFGECRANACIKAFNEAAGLTGLHYKVDFLVNTKGVEVACFAGDPAAAFKKAVSLARSVYRTPHRKGYDVIVANAFSKSNEADLAMHNALPLLNQKKGIVILVTHNTGGQINHYLLRSYGKFIGGRQYRIRTFLKPNIKYVIFSSHKEYNAFDTFDRPDLLIWKRSWADILNMIKAEFSNPKVAVFPDASIQLLR